jgi:hypothetical protein
MQAWRAKRAVFEHQSAHGNLLVDRASVEHQIWQYDVPPWELLERLADLDSKLEKKASDLAAATDRQVRASERAARCEGRLQDVTEEMLPILEGNSRRLEWRYRAARDRGESVDPSVLSALASLRYYAATTQESLDRSRP